MSNYIRVLPRDLFNEANLLKCLAHLYIKLETAGEHSAQYDVADVDHFDIWQNPDDGSIRVANLPFSIRGRRYLLSRPLNSRAPWPLYVSDPDNYGFEPIEVFDDKGNISMDMQALISS